MTSDYWLLCAFEIIMHSKFCTLKKEIVCGVCLLLFASHAIICIVCGSEWNPYTVTFCYCFSNLSKYLWYDFLYNLYACEHWTCDDCRLPTVNGAHMCTFSVFFTNFCSSPHLFEFIRSFSARTASIDKAKSLFLSLFLCSLM